MRRRSRRPSTRPSANSGPAAETKSTAAVRLSVPAVTRTSPWPSCGGAMSVKSPAPSCRERLDAGFWRFSSATAQRPRLASSVIGSVPLRGFPAASSQPHADRQASDPVGAHGLLRHLACCSAGAGSAATPRAGVVRAASSGDAGKVGVFFAYAVRRAAAVVVAYTPRPPRHLRPLRPLPRPSSVLVTKSARCSSPFVRSTNRL